MFATYVLLSFSQKCPPQTPHRPLPTRKTYPRPSTRPPYPAQIPPLLAAPFGDGMGPFGREEERKLPLHDKFGNLIEEEVDEEEEEEEEEERKS